MIRKVLLDVPPMVPFLDGDLQHVAMLSLAVVSLVAHGMLPKSAAAFEVNLQQCVLFLKCLLNRSTIGALK